MSQACLPLRRASLPNPHLDGRNKQFAAETPADLAGRGCLQKELESFGEIVAGIFDRVSLARDVELGTEAGETAFLLTDKASEPEAAGGRCAAA